jgi:uncharacterized protein (TIGR00251 family)
MSDALRQVEGGVVIKLWVVPGANKTAIDGYDTWKGLLKFKTKEPAKNNAANRSILEFFTSLLGKKTVLMSGEKSKRKEVLVLGATLNEVSEKLK